MPPPRNRPAISFRSLSLFSKTSHLLSSPKVPPAAVLLKKAANIAAGSKEPNKIKVGKVTRKQVMDIVKTKAKDLNARNDEAAFRIIAGTARQMGLEIVD